MRCSAFSIGMYMSCNKKLACSAVKGFAIFVLQGFTTRFYTGRMRRQPTWLFFSQSFSGAIARQNAELLVAERLDRVDARRPSRRNVASRQRHTEKENRDARKRGKIRRCHAEQQTSHQSREKKGQ